MRLTYLAYSFSLTTMYFSFVLRNNETKIFILALFMFTFASQLIYDGRIFRWKGV